MASLIKKLKKGIPYYYVVECKRINGNPRIVEQHYLGTAEKIFKTCQRKSAPVAKEVALTRIGPLALWEVACSTKLPEMIDAAFPKRDQGASVSQYLLLAALGRAFHPCSKSKTSQWYEETALKREWGLRSELFTSQHFWNAMDRIDLGRLTELEKDISLHIAKEENLSPQALLYDCTNYFTYIDTLNDRNTEARRGRNKQGRHNLRQLGLAVAVTPDFPIPLFHSLYPGNLNDITQFKDTHLLLTERIKDLSGNPNDITLVFDKGNTSEDILYSLQDTNIFCIASAPSFRYPEMAAIDLKKFQKADDANLPGVMAFRGKKEILGDEWTAVLQHSASFAAKQIQSVVTSQAKAIVKLEALSKKLKRGELPKATLSSVKKKVSDIVSPQHLKKIISTDTTLKDNRPILTYFLNRDALQELIDCHFGRTLLFTNRHGWSNAEIILGYHGQSEVERYFQDSKDREHLSFQPPYHWTDQKLHVHAFYCNLSMLLTGLLRRRLALKGLLLPPDVLLEKLNDLQEATLLYPQEKAAPPQLSYCLVRQDRTQKQLFKLLNLSQYTKTKENPSKSTETAPL
ncbi:MAG: IS1634 family transposase [Candidatus Scalindua sp.]|nr:IS1634 family transposase [Candidatus Scalindua sp.]